LLISSVSLVIFWEAMRMTGYTVHSGTTIKFSESWDRIFEGGESSARAESAKATKMGRAKQSKLAAAKKSKTRGRAGKRASAKAKIGATSLGNRKRT
jgi:hypothetical protein